MGEKENDGCTVIQGRMLDNDSSADDWTCDEKIAVIPLQIIVEIESFLFVLILFDSWVSSCSDYIYHDRFK